MTVWDQPQYYFPTYENDNLLCGLEELMGGDTDDTGFCSEDSVGQLKKALLKPIFDNKCF